MREQQQLGDAHARIFAVPGVRRESGGWIDPGETPEDAVVREAREELGVRARAVRVYRPFIAWNVPNSSDGSSFLLFNYRIELASTDFTLQPDEVTEARWFGPDEWAEAPMLPYVRSLFDERIGEWLAG